MRRPAMTLSPRRLGAPALAVFRARSRCRPARAARRASLLLCVPVAIAGACKDATGPNLAPEIRIVRPATSVRLLVGDTLTFRAEAEDAEEGPLFGERIRWLDDAGAELGTSELLPFRADEPGRLVVTAEVRDRHGLVALDRRGVEVFANGDPVITAVEMIPSTVYASDTVRLSVRAVDFETGLLGGEQVTWVAAAGDTLGAGADLTLPPGRLAEGQHQLQVIALDAQGNAVGELLELTVHSVPERVRWMRVLGQPYLPTQVIAARDEGPLYVGVQRALDDSLGYLAAYGLDGERIWRARAGILWDHSSGLTIAPDGTAYTFDYLGEATGIGPDGGLLWRSRILRTDPHGRFALSSDGALFAAGKGLASSSALLRISALDGSVLWELESTEHYAAGAFVDPAGNPLAQFDQDLVWADAQTGSVVQRTTHRRAHYMGAMGADGTIYLAGGSSQLMAVAPDGTLRWRVSPGGTPVEPVVTRDGGAFTATRGSAGGVTTAYAVDAEGRIRWRRELAGGSWIPRLALLADGTLYVAAGRTLYALSQASGALVWKTEMASEIDSPLVVTSEGAVYFLTEEARLVAIDGTARLDPDSPWPIWRGNNRRTASPGQR